MSLMKQKVLLLHNEVLWLSWGKPATQVICFQTKTEILKTVCQCELDNFPIFQDSSDEVGMIITNVIIFIL